MSDEDVNYVHLDTVLCSGVSLDVTCRQLLWMGSLSMRRILNIIGGLSLAVAVAFLIAFTAINFMLGCESWDERYWTEYNSCLTLPQLWEGLTR
jgi:hypothetical protein